MGQQQLILLVLGVVIVGLAVVIGIQAFAEQKTKADLDLTTGEAVRLATYAVAWRQAPQASGGGQSESTFSTFSLAGLGFSDVVVAGDGQHTDGPGLIYSVWQRSQPVSFVAVITADYTVQSAVFLYGPSERCLAVRTGRYRDGAWTYSPSETPPAPSGCAW